MVCVRYPAQDPPGPPVPGDHHRLPHGADGAGRGAAIQPAAGGQIRNALKQVPALVAAPGGNGNDATPQGFWQTEYFSLMVPAAVMVVTSMAGAKAVAGEEADRP
jgi:hypothetical protein